MAPSTANPELAQALWPPTGAQRGAFPQEIGVASLTITQGTRPKLLFLYQSSAVLMGLASVVAALSVAVLSLGS